MNEWSYTSTRPLGPSWPILGWTCMFYLLSTGGRYVVLTAVLMGYRGMSSCRLVHRCHSFEEAYCFSFQVSQWEAHCSEDRVITFLRNGGTHIPTYKVSHHIQQSGNYTQHLLQQSKLCILPRQCIYSLRLAWFSQ